MFPKIQHWRCTFLNLFSSAKSHTLQRKNGSESLRKVLKKIGPRRDRCGTYRSSADHKPNDSLMLRLCQQSGI